MVTYSETLVFFEKKAKSGVRVGTPTLYFSKKPLSIGVRDRTRKFRAFFEKKQSLGYGCVPGNYSFWRFDFLTLSVKGGGNIVEKS